MSTGTIVTPGPLQKTINEAYPLVQQSLAAQPVLGQDWASKRLRSMMTGDFANDDPSYAWRFQQGQQALERSQAAKGLLGSGNAATELVAYGQGLASTEYQSQFDRLLRASGNITNQFDSAINSLTKISGVALGIDNVNMSAQQQLQTQIANQQQQQGIADALQQMMYQQDLYTQGATSVSQPSYASLPSYSYSPSLSGVWSGGYSDYGAIQTNLPDNMGYGQGYITSSSGNTTTFGGYSGSTDYWGN